MLTFSRIIQNIEGVLNKLVGLLFVVATVVFLWGVIQYVIAGGDEKKLEQSRSFIIYGLIGLFVMVAMWGIVRAVCSTLFSGC